MITPNKQTVLTDFYTSITIIYPPITQTKIVLHPPGYISPERASGMPATTAAYLWSLSATLYAALCGQGPFDDRDDSTATLSQRVSASSLLLRSLHEIVNTLLCRDPT